MPAKYDRREMLRLTGQTAALLAVLPSSVFGRSNGRPVSGVLVGEPAVAAVANKIFADGGNAIDAVIAAALAAGITSPSKCGIGGYGGAMMIGRAGNHKVTCIDFDSMAPMAARPDMYPLDAHGNVVGKVNALGWLAAGVPGTLAGLQMALRKFGTKSFREVVQPAITMADKAAANPRFKYEALAKVLRTLADRNSVDSFYHGDLAQETADAFQKHGGLVTAKDLAAYKAREVKPYELEWNGATIYTAPLCAGGLTALQAMSVLKELEWEKRVDSLATAQMRLEALRLAWRDRSEFFGDPDFVKVPVKRLLSSEYGTELAGLVDHAVAAQKPVSIKMKAIQQVGTMHLSCADDFGNIAALTLTMGSSYGAQVTVENLGMVLGHGMVRFDPQPGGPNSVAPGKRPQHNMCPSIAVINGKPSVAVGAAGGTKIVNAIYDFFCHYVGRRRTLAESINRPRMNTTGSMQLGLDADWPAEQTEYFKKLGYQLKKQMGAYVSGVVIDPMSGKITGHHRAGNPFQSEQ